MREFKTAECSHLSVHNHYSRSAFSLRGASGHFHRLQMHLGHKKTANKSVTADTVMFLTRFSMCAFHMPAQKSYYFYYLFYYYLN